MKKRIIGIVSIVITIALCCIGMVFIKNNTNEHKGNMSNNINKENDSVNIDNTDEIDRKTIVTIDNGLGEGDDRLILLNDEVIARVFVADKIYDYKDYYVAIEKLDISDMDIIYKNLLVVDKYTGEKKEYELEKVEKNLGVCIESFDKDSGVVTIDTGITKYVFDINTRTMTEKI